MLSSAEIPIKNIFQKFMFPDEERYASVSVTKQSGMPSTDCIKENTVLSSPLSNKKANNKVVSVGSHVASSKSQDSRSTGGGFNPKDNHLLTRLTEKTQAHAGNHKKVSFKTKNRALRTNSSCKTTVTVKSSKVAELTKKFNQIILEQNSRDNSSKAASISVKSNGDLKIVVVRNNSKRRNNFLKRCSSINSLDIMVTKNKAHKKNVSRSKSDNNRKARKKSSLSKIRKSRSFDTVDGVDVIAVGNNSHVKNSSVMNVVKKFENEIIAQSRFSVKDSHIIDKHRHNTKNDVEVPLKPKLPEKKVTLSVTKNVVIKDGKPKIKSIKPSSNMDFTSTLKRTDEKCKIESRSPISNQNNEAKVTHVISNKSQLFDKILSGDHERISPKKDLEKNKYKTNYIHSDRLSFKIVEILPENTESFNNDTLISDCTESSQSDLNQTQNEPFKIDQEIFYSDMKANVRPNDSFLWRRLSTHNSSTDTDRSLYQINDNENNMSKIEHDSTDQNHIKESYENTLMKSQLDDTDFETNIVEAINSEVIKNTLRRPKANATDNDYETLEPIETAARNIALTGSRRSTKMNCPLPEIPKEPQSIMTNSCPSLPSIPFERNGDGVNGPENIYQCLLEMRSHPEGDESSIHSYELFDNVLEERTRGDGDSDDGYEYCKSPPKSEHTNVAPQQSVKIGESTSKLEKNYGISKSVSDASTVSYEKISGEAIYEKISSSPEKDENSPPTPSEIVSVLDYNGENFYDMIKNADKSSLSHCYESIPNSPSLVRLRKNFRQQVASASQKRLSFDAMSNASHCTLASDAKTNSIYGQRSVLAFGAGLGSGAGAGAGSGAGSRCTVAGSEAGSDRSDDWVDLSDQDDNNSDHKIVIVHGRARGRRSPTSWSRRVRSQWQKSPGKDHAAGAAEGESSDSGHYYESLEACGAGAARADQEGAGEEGAATPYEDDSDSFDSDSDADVDRPPARAPAPAPPLPLSGPWDERSGCPRLPRPPGADAPAGGGGTGGAYTLTRFASAAHRKMRELKRNLTKRYSVSMERGGGGGLRAMSPLEKGASAGVYANYPSAAPAPALPYKEELRTLLGDRLPLEPHQPQQPHQPHQPQQPHQPPLPEKPVTPVSADGIPNGKVSSRVASKEQGSLSRKAYLSLKSRFRRSASLALAVGVGVGEGGGADDAPPLHVTNSTFYLTDSVDGDSGFSNCSDSGGGGSSEALGRGGAALAPAGAAAGAAGAAVSAGARKPLHASSPCLAGGRPTAPPPPPPLLTLPCPSPSPPLQPPPPHAHAPRPPHADLAPLHEELKRLLPALSVRRERGERPERPERPERSSGRSRTSWYADCTPPPPPHSWYGSSERGGAAQSALEGQALQGGGGGGSVSSSGASSSGSPTPQHSLFTLEPLYQFYIADTVRSACQETGTDSDSDGYERVSDIRRQASEVGAGGASEGGGAGGGGVAGGVVSAGGVGGGGGMMAINGARGPQRTLWCELPEVAGSALLASLTPHQKKKQEALFEIVTSEASYLNSLEVLCAQFVAHPALREPRVLPPQDRHLFFDTILPVRRCSQRLMKELERAWRASITLEGVCEAVGSHARHHFHVYVAYCESQPLLVKALQRLRNNDTFAQVVRGLEASPAWQALSLHSFLMLPMQRVTRLPLLLDAVLRHTDGDTDPHYRPALQALHTLQKVVSECNEGARNMERAEEMFAICGAVEFPASLTGLAGAPPSLAPESSRAAGRGAPPRRYLVRRGPLTHLAFHKEPKEMKLTFGKRYHKHQLHAFLFNDLLLLTKKKSEESYVAVDWCERSLVEVVEGEEVCGGVGSGGAAAGAGAGVGPAAAKHAMLLTLLHNAHGKTVEMLVTCASETERARWREALEGGRRDDSGATVYEGWDCPQVVAVWEWGGRLEGDELPLQAGDVVNVLRKTREGWYWGERLRDARAGWFPGAYTHELLSPHVRARNLRTRYRLLALSHTYLGHAKH